jgi:hypothetical protein
LKKWELILHIYRNIFFSVVEREGEEREGGREGARGRVRGKERE